MRADIGVDNSNEFKIYFTTREGVYKVVSCTIDSPKNYRSATSTKQPPCYTSEKIRISYYSKNDSRCVLRELVAFNIGRDLYFYNYQGVRRVPDLSLNSLEKRIYTGTIPTCHDFYTDFSGDITIDNCYVLIGFTAGQVQLIDINVREFSKLFNEERNIDRSKVTCLQWVPNSGSQFLVAHASGCMYLYDEAYQCGISPPHYNMVKSCESYCVYVPKSRSIRNPVNKWMFDDGAVHAFAFSPDGTLLSVVSQDGFMRVFNFSKLEQVGCMKSYFGGLLCCAWSSDGEYVATGGEDDLIHIWSSVSNTVIARAQGHHSWISSVAFDPFSGNLPDSDNDGPINYRIGSVGQDTFFCYWELTDEILRPKLPLSKLRNYRCSINNRTNSVPSTNNSKEETRKESRSRHSIDRHTVNSNRLKNRILDESARIMGTPQCPPINAVPIMEPLVQIKVGSDRLTSLVFKQDCFIIACQDGHVSVWARPGRNPPECTNVRHASVGSFHDVQDDNEKLHHRKVSSASSGGTVV